MTLYELMTDYTNFLSAVESGDIPEEAIADTLEAIEATVDEKIDNTACLIKTLAAEEAAIKAEEERLAKRRKVKENTRGRVETYLSDMLLAMGKTEFESARNKISFRKTPGKVVVANEKAFIEWAAANDESLITIGKPTLNKTAIKQALESGKQIDGAEIVASQNMQLK
jgi:hypothetical protein